ncbi:MAG TPA: hypothetical protein VFV99_19315 [Kofleriaceae bacterium]|nr:hypothetical protein [Kofleriaceae bacterium]
MDGAGDAKDDSFGGAGAKEDGQYSACQLAEVLKLVNESTSTADKLESVGVADNAARAIVKHRVGPDGDAGTGDDDIFDDLNELDGVDYVGNLALGKLVYAVLPRCENDLTTRPFIDSTTFTGQSGGWARDNEEVEVVLGVKGMTGQKLRELLLQKNSTGRTLYERMRKARVMEAFTYGYALDEMPWTSDAQAARELLPYVSLTIEPGRYEPNDEGELEISLGTDLMDDTYYDTHGYSLLGNGIELRGRARWDDPTTVRRILIAAKFGTEVDADGNKVNSKVDIRNDNGTSFIPKLDDDVRRGKVAWSGSDAPATPIRGVYEQLKMKNVLLDIGSHTGVLLLEPAVHLRSTRSRYHMNEANLTNVRGVFQNATTRINAALAVVDRAQAAGIIPAANRAAVDAMEAMGRGILDKSLIAQRLGTTVTALRLPDNWAQPGNATDLEANKKTAEAINALYHEFATALDDTDRAITNAADESFDSFTDMFRLWRISQESTLARKTAWDPFLNSYRSLSTATNRANAIAQFNTYGAAQKAANNDAFDDFVALDDAGWTRLGNYLEKMTLTTGERQIETAGIAARQLWFDQARTLYVPGSSRAFSNFMIDTTDMTEMLTHEEWLSIPEAERSFAQPLPAAKVFNTVFVNELQIELGMEKAYVDRLRALEAQLAMNPNDAATKAQLEGARFVWQQYTESMKVLTELKGDNVIDRLKRAGAPQGITWSAPPDSKGNIALKILADRD